MSHSTQDLSQLSTELLVPILTATDITDLPQITVTNSRLKEICTDPYFWQEKFKRDDLPLDIPTTLTQWMTYYNETKQAYDRAKKIWQNLRDHHYEGLDNQWDELTGRAINPYGLTFYLWYLPSPSILTSVGIPATLVQSLMNKMSEIPLLYNPHFGRLDIYPFGVLNHTSDNQWVIYVKFIDPAQPDQIIEGLSGSWIISPENALTCLYHLIKAKVSLYGCHNYEV
jgi:hypothetical protein